MAEVFKLRARDAGAADYAGTVAAAGIRPYYAGTVAASGIRPYYAGTVAASGILEFIVTVIVLLKSIYSNIYSAVIPS